MPISLLHSPRTPCTPARLTPQAKFQRGPTLREAPTGCAHLLELLAARGRRLALAAPPAWLQQHAVPQAQVAPVASDAEAVTAAMRALGSEAAAAPGAAWQAGQQAGQAGQAVRRPPDLVWMVLGDLWEHLEAAAQSVSEQASAEGLLAGWRQAGALERVWLAGRAAARAC